MVKYFDTITPQLLPWIEKQQMFWVATAPLSGDGHVNVSPKGVEGTFHVVDGNRVWYEDLTGSGNETISHLRENGRVTIMFTAFEGAPRICRLFGRGTVHEFDTPEYNALIPPESRKPSSRAAIVIDVHKVGTSCGYAVPYYQFLSHRNILQHSFSRPEALDCNSPFPHHADKGLKAYWEKYNLSSLDGLPGLLTATHSTAAPASDDSWRASRVTVPGTRSANTLKSKRDDIRLLAAFSTGFLVAAVCFKLSSTSS
ncbi:hypothetical protein JAAARDRAFT_127292 [Jaapia argillacea MUCL 33604]|uniref:Pyridoxamine 5'-phosphate oxidase N-terminal domain-containing protein n=1 Tax=Jaapia argillacea MUCL 33604 TaxID=933084 RepID=A0A067PXG6_9AGAM|nr:hypothetical protein JAAARDRAFT_127292 [Jaapia argillacea MUCL 33604]